ncbi:MAG: ribonuclease HII, partial [Cytophagales bacterium]|nr:ribonuclease HII [Cytophagales bacterium]
MAKTEKHLLLSSHTGTLCEAGLDEAGRGCLAGPVVAAAVILPHDYTHPLLNDSKQLTRSQRDSIREDIIKDALDYAIAEVSPKEIDEINILKASFLAMHRCVDQLKSKPKLLLIDGNRFTPYPSIEHLCVIKGDGKYLSIAAASILAKTHRDELMERLAKENPGYGWEKNMGYPTKAHRDA